MLRGERGPQWAEKHMMAPRVGVSSAAAMVVDSNFRHSDVRFSNGGGVTGFESFLDFELNYGRPCDHEPS